MKVYGQDLIGLDVKPRRKDTRIRQNRFKANYACWLLPAIITLVCLIVMIGTR